MSRVYFHSPSGEAELRGAERAWLGFVAAGPARAAWGLDRHVDLERMAEIVAMVPEVPDGQYGANYLHTYLREAQAEDAANKRAYDGWKPGSPQAGPTSYEASKRLLSSLQLRITGRGTGDDVFEVAGQRLGVADVALNTALAAGSAPVQLAAKIDGWCEVHAWVDGPDRAWLADIIAEGLASGIYRRGLWYADLPDTPRDKYSTMGWEEVQVHLRSRDDEPVVMSYSVCDQFPSRAAAGWEPPPMPDGWTPRWVDDDDGRAEWERDYPTPEQKAEQYAESAGDTWYDLPSDEQWSLAMAALRTDRPWLQLTPESLGGTTFGPGVTVYDLLGPDREERVRARLESDAVALIEENSTDG